MYVVAAQYTVKEGNEKQVIDVLKMAAHDFFP